MSASLADFPAALRPCIAALLEAEHKAAYDTGFKAGYSAGERDAVKRMPRVVPREYRIAAIQRLVAEHYGVPAAILSASFRSAPIAQARQVAMYLARETTGRSFPAIGRHFGGRDHSTVVHGVKTVAARIAADPDFAAEMAGLRAAAQRIAA
ncbi:MAG: helix-turn-helix domain-containing protein [Alphaproteobacteria bacterium]